MPLDFLGGNHFTSIDVDPVAVTTGGLNSSGGASAVRAYARSPTPQPTERKNNNIAQ